MRHDPIHHPHHHPLDDRLEAVTAGTPADALAEALRADSARPLVTFYDDATGERVELSGATFANWVAKTANLLVDGLGLGPGGSAALLLPAHWQTAALAVGCWSAGLQVTIGAGAGDDAARTTALAASDVVFAGPDELEVARRSGAEVLGLSLRPLGGRLPDVPVGVTDYAAEVPAYGDAFSASEPAGAAEMAAAHAAAERWRVQPGERILSVLPYTDPDGLAAGLLVPLLCGGGVVLCRNADPAALPRRADSEQVTATAGVTLPGPRRLV